jgi:DNA-binding MarR family transcriptional regulator
MAGDQVDRWMPAWLALTRTHARLWDQVEAQMRRASGLTMPRYDVLMQLENAGGRLGLTDLAEAVVLSPSGLSKLLDRMSEAGLVTREPDADDARSTFATITPTGRALVRRARKAHHTFLQEAFGDALAAPDTASLVRIMNRIDERSRAR